MNVNQNADKWKEKGDQFFDSKNYNQAIKSYGRARQIDPKAVDQWLYNDKGKILFTIGKYEEAIKFFNRAIESDQEDAFSWYNKGTALHNLHNYEQAIECYNEAIKLKPDYVWPRIDKAGAILSLKTNIADAMKCADEALEIDPNNAVAWVKKGSVLNEMGKYEEAIKFFEKSLEIKSDYEDAWIEKGNAFYYLNQLDATLECYNWAVDKINPKNSWSWNNIGVCLHIKGNHHDAIKCFEKALKIDPTYTTACLNKAGCLLDVDDLSEAEKSFNESVRLYRKSLRSVGFAEKLNLAELLILARRYHKARNLLSTLALDQTQDIVYQCVFRFLLAVSYLLERDSAKSRISLESFLEYYKNLKEDLEIDKKRWDFELLATAITKGNANMQIKFILLCIIDLFRGKLNRQKIYFFNPIW